MKTTNKRLRELAVKAVKGLKKFISNREFLLITCMILYDEIAHAQTAGSAAFANASKTISGYMTVVFNLFKTIVVVISIVNILKEFLKLQMGDQDAKKKIMRNIKAYIIFAVMIETLPLFFE